ncbi:MAG TPA: hypothetical protein VGJ84_05255 [Polyangiaceae bacterium]
MDIARRIRGVTDDFMVDLRQLIKAIARERVAHALSGSVNTGFSRGRATRSLGVAGGPGPLENGTENAHRRPKRTRVEVEALTDKLLAFIEANPGKRMEEISAGIGVGTRELTLPMRNLIREKHLRTEGHKRATSYFAR